MKSIFKAGQLVFAAFIIAAFNSCITTNKPIAEPVSKIVWGQLPAGQDVELFTLTSKTGVEIKITTYGGTITSWKAPDSKGNMSNIVLGFDSLAPYLKGTPFFGAIMGRYANRIAKGQFILNDTTYNLAINNGPNHLHGGILGYDKVLWIADTMCCSDESTLKLTYFSKHNEEGYPGNVNLTVVYALNNNDLTITYEATTDMATPINLTNHSYFNLAGKGKILDHLLTIAADNYTLADSVQIPTGEIAPVAGTPLDFTKVNTIGSRIASVAGGGYDHNYVLNNYDGSLQFAAQLHEPISGRTIEVYTTEPAMQLYSGIFLKGDLNNGDWIFDQYSGVCLETQHFPDSPNHTMFPNTILNPGQTFKSTTVYKCGVK